MRKLWILIFKEIKLTFRDTGAIISMLVTPIALTLAMAAAFGNSSSTPLSDIPVLLLNQDSGPFATFLIDIFQSEEVSELIALETVTDEAAARARVEADEVAALILIPADFSARVFPLGESLEAITGKDLTAFDQEGQFSELTVEQQNAIAQASLELDAAAPPNEPGIIELYASPDWQISTAVVKGILTQGLEIINLQIAGTAQTMEQLMGTANTEASEINNMSSAATTEINDTRDLPIHLQITSASGRGFRWLDYYASNMAVLFLMFSVTAGGRTLLNEREGGTLPRLLISPTDKLTVLTGKMGGVIVSGILQVLVLWGASGLIGAYWGPPLAVITTIVAVVLCASGVGAIISAWAQTPGQAASLGTIVSLVGSAMSGSFLPRSQFPAWVQNVSLITPNAWGIEIFSRIQQGQGFTSIIPWLLGLLGLTVIYYGIALLGFRRQFD